MAYEKPTLLNKTDESVRLSWAPVSTHSLPADSRRVSYVVESRELPSSVWTKVAYNVPISSYLVRHLRPDKEYEFRVRAQNQHGVSEPSRTATMEKRVGQLPPLEHPCYPYVFCISQNIYSLYSLYNMYFPEYSFPML